MTDIEFKEMLEKIRGSVSDGLDRTHEIMQKVAASAPGNLPHYLGELVSRRGKRMRATFVLLIALSENKDAFERAALSASSIELLHLATLVHDDIIDESDLRRNGLTAHKRWGPRIAVLVGDYALSKALDLIIDDQDRRIPSCLSTASGRLIAGEIMEINQLGNLDISLNGYLDVIYGKTASLWEACGQVGAYLAGFSADLSEKCALMGRNLGIAFQIIDDLLDFGIGARNTGKKGNLDLKNGIITLPLILFLQSSTQENSRKLKDLLTNSDDSAGLEHVKEMLSQSDCFIQAKKMAMDKINFCIDSIRSFPKSKHFDYIAELCEVVAHRSA